MPAPSKNFTVIADSAVDAESPVDTSLMQALRDNDQHLKEWLGKDYVAEQNHNHDGVNSKSVGGMQIMLMDEDVSNGSQSFVSVKNARIYIPADITTLTYTALVKIATLGTPDMRLNIGATDGSTISGTTDGTAYNWTASEGTIDVSALSGWQTFNIQLKASLSSHTAYLKTVFCRLT